MFIDVRVYISTKQYIPVIKNRHFNVDVMLMSQRSWIVCCLHLEKEFRSCARGSQWCGIHHNH